MLFAPGALRPMTRCGFAQLVRRRLASTEGSATSAVSRQAKKEATIEDAFQNMTSLDQPALPPRFSDLKKELVKDPEALERSWHAVLKELESDTAEIECRGSEMVLCVSFEDIQQGLSEDQLRHLKKTGVIVIQGGVPREEASSWLEALKQYIAINADKVKGAPRDKPVWYELYNSPSQIAARTHPGLLASQAYLLSLWNASPNTPVSTRTPVSYFDRCRIRLPGPSAFTLGPHVDGGSIERWEDPGYRQVYRKILQGDDAWRSYDPFDVAPRLGATTDLYNAPSQCTIFRPWQGWTAISSTGPGQGTLQVLPSLGLATAYIILRPFFRLRSEHLGRGADIALDADAWRLDLNSSDFPGSTPANGQAVLPETHPHLRVEKTVVSIPRVEPGDQVYWHTDIVHAVESEHNGPGDSSVLYIPAVPLTEKSAAFLRDQRSTFLEGLPSPDFPGGEGESQFLGRAKLEDIHSGEGRRALGFEPFGYPAYKDEGERVSIGAANKILGF